MASVSISCPPVQLLTGWCVTAKAPPDISAISALTAVKHGNCSSLTPLLNPVRTRKSLICHEWRWMPGNSPHYGRWPQHDFTSLKKLRPQSVTSRIQPGSDVIVCAEMDEQWGYVGAKSRSAGCFTRMTVSGRRLLRTYSVNALWRRWGVL